MASTATTHDEGTPFPFLKLLPELRNGVYRFAMPSTLRPWKSSSKVALQATDEQKLSISLFLINRQVYQEISHVLYQYSHFLISIDCRGPCGIESSIFWESYQPGPMSVNPVSSIKHIDIELVWAQRSASIWLLPALKVCFQHLRAFRCLRTLTVKLKKAGGSTSRPCFDRAIFILEPLEQLQTDLPHVQINVQATQQQSNSELDDRSNDLKAYIQLPDYLPELRGKGEYPDVAKE